MRPLSQSACLHYSWTPRIQTLHTFLFAYLRFEIYFARKKIVICGITRSKKSLNRLCFYPCAFHPFHEFDFHTLDQSLACLFLAEVKPKRGKRESRIILLLHAQNAAILTFRKRGKTSVEELRETCTHLTN